MKATEQPRIVHVIDSMGRGGAERHLLQLCVFLAGCGVEQTLVQLFEEDSLLADAARAGVHTVTLGVRRSVGSIPELLRKLLPVVERARPDVVSTQLVFSDIVGRAVARKLRKPTVSIWQNTTYDSPDRATQSLSARVAYQLLRNVERLTMPGATRFVAVSETVRRSYSAALNVDADRCVVIPNTLDLSRFPANHERKAAKPGSLKLAHVGRHVTQKAIPVLLDALAIVPRDIDVHVELYGQGPLTASLREHAERRGVSDRVSFKGSVGSVVPHLMSADAFVFPSSYEGLALALLEAYAASLPVIASGIPSNLEIDAKGEATLFFPPGDAAALAKSIHSLALDVDRRRTMATAARGVVERFRIETIGPQMLDLYREAAIAR